MLQLLSGACGAGLFAAAAAAHGESGCDRMLGGSLLTGLVFCMTSEFAMKVPVASRPPGDPDHALMLLTCLAVASASDLQTLSVPDAVWGAGALGRLTLGMVYGWPIPDMVGFGLLCLACLAVVYAPGIPRAGGADIAAVVTASLFVGPLRALSIAWVSCAIAAASGFGSRLKQVPFMPYLLCGTCLVTLGSP
jgi:hypothetical protein